MKSTKHAPARTAKRHATLSVSAAISAILAAAAQMRAGAVLAQISSDNATQPAGTAAAAGAAATPSSASNSGLEEVVVTATRRAENVLSIPYNISAITGVDLQSSGITNANDLANMIPGVQAPNAGLRGNTFPQYTIRGLNVSPNGFSSGLPGGEAPLVSMYSDDTPLQANLTMTDLARVEVLRGPQSTLYGQGAVGGTVRLIHNQPDPTQTEFQVTVNASDTYHTEQPNGSVDTVFNLPLSDSIALRGTAGWEGLAGFTNAESLVALTPTQQPVLANPANPLSSGLTFAPRDGADDATQWYGRLAGLWKMSDAAQATLTYEHQYTFAGAFPDEEPGYNYAQNLYWREWGRNNTDLASLDVSMNAGFATISSTTSFSNQIDTNATDETGLIEEINSLLYGNYPRVVSPLFNNDQTRTYTEELRFVSNGAGPLTWVAGIWYSYQYAGNGTTETVPGYAAWTALPGSGSYPTPACTVYNAVTCPYPTFDDFLQSIDATPPSMHLPGTPADGNYYYDAHTYFHDFAPLYGEITYHLTDKWQVTGGARIIIQSFSENIGQELPICGAFCSLSGTSPIGNIPATSATSYHKQVYKGNTSYEVAPNTMLYYTWSQGFRRGGANALPIGTCIFCVPASQLAYQPDLAVNNEVGIKGRLPQGTTYTFDVFNIDWEHPQISGTEPISGLLFIGNATSARSRGVEAEVTIPVTTSTRILLGYAYTDAVLTASFNIADGAITGVSGDPLPAVSKQQGSASVDYSRPLQGSLSFNARADLTWRSDFWTETPHSIDAAILPGYELLNLRAGFGVGEDWTIDAYVDNLANAQGVTGFTYTKAFTAHNYAYLVSRPRTVGIELNYAFAGRRK